VTTSRFEPVLGNALVALPPFRLEERQVEILAPGDHPLWVIVPAYDEASGIDDPVIWTDKRDQEMWAALQGG